jgi:hypothetical protein
MQPSSKSFWLILTLALFLGYFNVPAIAQHGGHTEIAMPERPYMEKVRVNDQAEVKFSSDTRVGDSLLKRGKYRLKHVVEGEDHFIAFTRIDQPGKQADSATVPQEALRARCRLEPLGKPAKQTEFYMTVSVRGDRTIERLQVQGENVKHVF